MSARIEARKSLELKLQGQKELVRYLYSVVTLDLPVHFAIYFVALSVSYFYLNRIQWTTATWVCLFGFVYFSGSWILGAINLKGVVAKFVKADYTLSDDDPFVKLCSVLADVKLMWTNHWNGIQDLRARDPTKFTFQVCFVCLLGALVGSWFDGVDLIFASLFFSMIIPAVVAKKLHHKVIDILQPHVAKIVGMLDAVKDEPEASAKEVDTTGSSSENESGKKPAASQPQPKQSKKDK